MKRQITIALIFYFLSIFSAASALATVSGDCEACHTVTTGIPLKPGEPFLYLLKGGSDLCIKCHSSATGETIKIMGNSKVPIVHNTSKPEIPLAGGNFRYVDISLGGSDAKGHNVEGIVSQDVTLGNKPPGYHRASDPSVIGYNENKRLTCAGSNGCHGDRNIKDTFAAIRGTHHAKDTPLDGSTTARSYRYLKNTAKVKGVIGLEDSDWEYTNSATDHNEYTSTINYLCASCHGDFHSVEGPWFRHPVDVILPKGHEYANYKVYSVEAPVAREVIPTSPTDVVKPGVDMVMCLSCHRAHASPYDAILRWDYDAMISGEENAPSGGCFTCHSGKRYY